MTKLFCALIILVIGFEIGWHTAVLEMGIQKTQAAPTDPEDEEESLVPVIMYGSFK
jgi:hypothetical protein